MQKSNKNLLITLEWPPHFGGVGRMYFNLVAALPDQFVVWAPRGSQSIGNLEMVDTPLLSVNGWPRWRALFANLFRLLKARTFKKIVVGQVFPIGLPVYLLSHWFGYKYDVFVHGLDMLSPMRSWRRRWLLKKILNSADHVLAANKNVAEIVHNFASRVAVTVVYPSPFITATKFKISRQEARQALGLDERPIILTVSRLVPRKGHRYVLEALPAIVQEYPNCLYAIIGEGLYSEEINKLAQSSGMANSIKMLGALSDEATARWYAAADIFILTPFATSTDVEGLGVVYLEAASFGRPIVASRSGGVTEFVVDNDNGLLVNEKNSADITAAVGRLLASDQLRTKLGESGRRKVELFAADKQAAKICL